MPAFSFSPSSKQLDFLLEFVESMILYIYFRQKTIIFYTFYENIQKNNDGLLIIYCAFICFLPRNVIFAQKIG